jgi:hypothetical protein
MKLVQTHLAATFPMFEKGESLFFLDVALAMGLAPLVMLAVFFAGGLCIGAKWPWGTNSQDNVKYNTELSAKHPYASSIIVLASMAAFMWVPYWYFDGDLPPIQ